MDSALILCKWVHYLTAMLLFGGSLFRLRLGSGAAAIDRALGRSLAVAAVGALLSTIFWLLLEAGNMGDGWADMLDPATVSAVVVDTSFGHVFAARLLLALIFLPVAMKERWALLAPASGLFLASVALTGHAAMDEGTSGLIHQTSHAVHLLAGGAWLGALLPLRLVLRRTADDPLFAVEAGRRFSAIGYVAVTLVVASGLGNSWFLIGSLGELFTTSYGLALVAKLALIGGMLVCAALNRLIFLPRRAVDGLGKCVAAEFVLGAGVLAAASLLGTLPPPF